jgi:hypothetical protein
MSLSDQVLAIMGEQVAAARHDWETCDPGDVGLNGVIIKQWREGYMEGCKDMVNVIVSRVPEDQRKEVGDKITASFKAEGEKLKELAGRTPQATDTAHE